jgi:hypothetical protein
MEEDDKHLPEILKSYLPDKFRIHIEKNYYAKISERAALENCIHDEDFLENPEQHIALYPDKSIQAIRQTACNFLHILERLNGVWITHKEGNRLKFMENYGVWLTYLQDIGLCNMTHYGLTMHSEFGSQAVFAPKINKLIEKHLWEESAGNVGWTLWNMHAKGFLVQKPEIVLKEILAMCMCQDPDKVSLEVLEDNEKLRDILQKSIQTNLWYLYHQQNLENAQKDFKQAQESQADEHRLNAFKEKVDETHQLLLDVVANNKTQELQNLNLQFYYNNFKKESYNWLLSSKTEVLHLIEDVKDTIKIVRCTNRLRKRNVPLKNSAGYYILPHAVSAKAIFAFHGSDHRHFYWLESENPALAGEANIASCDIDKDFNIKISFQKGLFDSPSSQDEALKYATQTAWEIWQDCVVAFHAKVSPSEIKLILEHTPDNFEFAPKIAQKLNELGLKTQIIASLKGAGWEEAQRYENGIYFTEYFKQLADIKDIVRKINGSGHLFSDAENPQALEGLKVAQIKSGEILIKENTQTSFVYVPFGEGLRWYAQDVYPPTLAKAWMPLGCVELIQNQAFTMRLVAEKDLNVLMIPKQTYLQYWFKPYNTEDFTEFFKNKMLR